jgi:hypothetical protein
MLHDLQYIRLGLPSAWEHLEPEFRRKLECWSKGDGLLMYRERQLDLAGAIGNDNETADAAAAGGVGGSVLRRIEREWDEDEEGADEEGRLDGSGGDGAGGASSTPAAIPQILHHYYYGSEDLEELHPQHAEWRQQWLRHFPRDRFQHMVWNERNGSAFMAKQFPRFHREVWLRYSMDIQRADSIRYFLLSHFGGEGEEVVDCPCPHRVLSSICRRHSVTFPPPPPPPPPALPAGLYADLDFVPLEGSASFTARIPRGIVSVIENPVVLGLPDEEVG